MPGRLLYAALAGSVLLLAVALAVFPTQEFDLFMYLAIAREYVQTGGFPTVDPFLASMPDYHWQVLHEWGGYLLWYGAHLVGGWSGVLFLKVALIVASLAVPLVFAWRIGYASPLPALLTGGALLASALRFTERTSLFSDLFNAVTLAILLLEYRRPGRLRYLLPPLFIVWVNLHAGFYPGLGLVGLFAAAKLLSPASQGDKRSFLVCALLAELACLVNPKGLGGALYPMRTVFDPSWNVMRKFNMEWMPTFGADFGGGMSSIAFTTLAVAVVGLLVLAIRAKAKPWVEAVAILILIAFGVSAIRFVPSASFALAILGVHLGERARVLQSTRLATVVAAVAMVATLVFAVRTNAVGYKWEGGQRRPGVGLDMRFVPEKAAAFYREKKLPGRLFNDHAFGGYLAWLWDGDEKLHYHGFVDDMRFYREDYLGINAGAAHFDRIVRTYGIGTFILQKFMLDPKELPWVYRHLQAHPEFRLVYQDEVAVIFTRVAAK